MSNQPLIYDPGDPSHVADPYPFYRRLRNEAPVYWWAAGHMWLLSRYVDVKATLEDPRFTTDVRRWRHYQQQSGMPASIVEIRERGLLAVGPDDHMRIRKLVAPSFFPRAAEAREAQATLTRERERLQWQLEEIGKLAPGADEWPELNAEHQHLSNAQSLIDAARGALDAVTGPL